MQDEKQTNTYLPFDFNWEIVWPLSEKPTHFRIRMSQLESSGLVGTNSFSFLLSKQLIPDFDHKVEVNSFISSMTRFEEPLCSRAAPT
jgi:hypothetical protein